MQILLGTNNKHKVQEIRTIINHIVPGRIDFILPEDIIHEPFSVDETGDNLSDNALLKAKSYYEKAQIPCLSDDTGLEINALNGEPGVISARYAGKQGDDVANRKKVLEQLKDVPNEQRTAQFRTVLCFFSSKTTIYSEGICKGMIIRNEKGSNGFGYDPVFVPDGHIKTFAEMTEEEKNQISHRRKAIESFAYTLKERFEHGR